MSDPNGVVLAKGLHRPSVCRGTVYCQALHVRISSLSTDLATARGMRQARRASAVRRWQQAFAQFVAREISR
jgi:hypothetical protein